MGAHRLASVCIPEISVGRSVGPASRTQSLGSGAHRAHCLASRVCLGSCEYPPWAALRPGPGQDRGPHRTVERNRVWLVFSSPNLPPGQVTRSLLSRGGSVCVAMDGDQAWRRDTMDRKSALRPSLCIRKGSSGRQEAGMRPRQGS